MTKAFPIVVVTWKYLMELSRAFFVVWLYVIIIIMVIIIWFAVPPCSILNFTVAQEIMKNYFSLD